MSTALNEIPLQYWRETGYTIDDINEVGRQIDTKYMLARLDFIPGQPLIVTISKRVDETRQGHFPTIIDFFREILTEWEGEPLRGSLLIFLEDGMWHWEMQYPQQAPIISFSRHLQDNYSFVMPDPAFINSRAYEDDKKMIDEYEKDYPWENKKQTIFWRGSSTGLDITGHDWKMSPRIRLGIISKQIDTPEKLDAYLSAIIPLKHVDHTERILDLDIIKDRVPQEEFYQNKFQVDVDGMSNAWMSCFLKLYSQSATLKVESSYHQWYYDEIAPWQHYIPLSREMKEMEHLIKWLEEHDTYVRGIAENSTSFMNQLTYERAKKEVGELVAKILACQKIEGE